MKFWQFSFFILIFQSSKTNGNLDDDLRQLLESYGFDQESLFNFTEFSSKTVKFFPTRPDVYGIIVIDERTDLSEKQIVDALKTMTSLCGGIIVRNSNVTNFSFLPESFKDFMCDNYGLFIENNKLLSDASALTRLEFFPYEFSRQCNIRIKNNPKLDMAKVCSAENMARLTDMKTSGNLKNCGKNTNTNTNTKKPNTNTNGKTPKSTTPSPFLDYYGNPADIEFFQYNIEEADWYVRQASAVDIFISFLGFFFNIFHLCMLFRADLRYNTLFIFMMGICICDIILFSGKFIYNFLEWNIIYVVSECRESRAYFHHVIRWLILASQPIARHISAIIVLLLSGFQLFSVVLDPVISILVLVGISGVCMGFHGWFFWHYELEESRCGWDITYQSYGLKIDHDFLLYQRKVNDYITCVLFGLFAISSVLMFVRLRRAIQYVKNEYDDSVVLIFLLSLMFLISESLYFSCILFAQFLLQPYYLIQWYFIRMQVVTNTVITICSFTHNFICMLASSDYMDSFKKLFSRKNEKTIPSVDLASNSTIKSGISNIS